MNQKNTCLGALRLVGSVGTLVFILTVFTPLLNRVGVSLVLDPTVRGSDAIVVLGAGISPDGGLADESLRRAVYGMQLYKRGMAPLLIVSGSPRQGASFRPEAEIRKEIATQMGIPEDRILVITSAMTTRDESMEVARLLAPRGATTILLVTESLHMRRATLVFRRAGLNVYPAPSDNLAHFAANIEDRLYLLRRIVQETTGLLYYRLAGYI